MAEAYKKRGTKKAYDGTSTDDAFNFKISESDFKNKEEAVSFLTHVYQQPNISNYIKGAVIVHFRREQEGYGFEEVEEAIAFRNQLKESNQLDEFQRLMKFIDLYGLDEIMSFVDNKGKVEEEMLAKNLGEQVIRYLQNNMPIRATISTPMELQSQVEELEEKEEAKPKTASVVNFNDDDDDDE